MTTTIKTRYICGVFQPLETVHLPEGLNVTVLLEDTIPTIDSESRQWLDNAAHDLADHLTEIEADLPQDKVASWHNAMNQASKPVRYDREAGFIVVDDEI